MKRLETGVAVFGLLALFDTALAAGPRGNVIAPEDMGAEVRADILAQIEAARAADPDAFGAFADLRDKAAALDKRKRGRLAPMSVLFNGLGARGLWPMVEMLAFDAPERGDLTDTAWASLRAGAIEAVGELRDPRAAPVLLAILHNPVSEYYVARASAEAVGLLLSDQAVDALTAAVKASGGERRFALLAGAGHCRRAEIARVLASALTARPDERTAQMLARSLSDVGNSYVWRIPRFVQRGDGAEVRAIAAGALVDGFVHYSGHVRTAMSNALMVVDSEATPALIEAATKAAAPELRQELERLAKRFEENPVR